MQNYSKHVSKRATPQNEPIPGDPDSVPNNAGGYAYKTSAWDQLDRFLILGSMGGTYYVGESKLTKDNATNILALIQEDGLRVVSTIVDISDKGRAPSNDPALFALALCASCADNDVRRAARAALPKVARIGTHLFHFMQYFKAQSGNGRGIRTALSKWYIDKSVRDLAYQTMKYQQRDGWSNRDILRLARPTAKAAGPERAAILDWITHGKTDGYERPDNLPEQLNAFLDVQGMKEPEHKEAAKIIVDYRLTLDMIPKDLLKHNDVWEALLENMPVHALVRNLGQLTSRGLLDPMSEWQKKVVERLSSESAIQRSRMHPLALLVAQKIYANGEGLRGGKTWDPNAMIIDVLDAAFYTAFGNVESTGKSMLLALDVSGSMKWGNIANSPLTPAEGAGAMAMVTAQVEPVHAICAFSHEFKEVNISKKQRLDDVIKTLFNQSFGGTDCSLPMIWALRHKIAVDTFVIYTDSETWAGRMHPVQALKEYRDKMGKNAKLVVVGMEGNDFTIADPKDPGMLDIVGFDTGTPNVIADFSAG